MVSADFSTGMLAYRCLPLLHSEHGVLAYASLSLSLSLSLSFIHFDLEYSFFVVRMLVCVPHIQIDCNTSATAVLASRKQDHRSFQALHRGSAYVFRLVALQPRVVDDDGQRGTATELAHESVSWLAA